MNIKALAEQMYEDELRDKASHYGKVTPREAARILRVAPQLVYYRIRNHRLNKLTCSECGREGLVDWGEVQASFGKTEDEAEGQEEGREELEPGGTED
jgi:hypothetical protein